MDLGILVFSPLLISLFFLLPIFSGKAVLIRRIAKVFALLNFAYALLFLVFYNTNSPYNFEKEITFFGQSWLESLGISLTFALDGISLLFIILTSFLILIACMASKGIIRTKHNLYYALIFMLQTSILGVFCSKDMFAFFIFWELELIPMYFLISLWGGENAKKSAMKFLLYTFAGSLFMLCGFLMLYNFNYISSSELTANLDKLTLDYSTVPFYLQILASILIFIGFAVKLPVIPLHNWLPYAHTDSATPISMLLAGILLKMGGYGIIRFNISLLPDAFLYITPYIVILAFINIVFAAFLAYAQNDIKRIVAYSSISVMGIVLLGLCSLNTIGITGAVYLMFAHGIISAGLFFVVGIIYRRTKTREISQLGGLSKAMPRLFLFANVLVLASIGLPLLISFPAEFLVFFGAFMSSLLNNYYIQVIALTSIIVLVLSACYLLRLMHNTFYGEMHERWQRLSDVIVHEFVILFIFTAAAILFGIFPMTIIDMIQPNIQLITSAFGG